MNQAWVYWFEDGQWRRTERSRYESENQLFAAFGSLEEDSDLIIFPLALISRTESGKFSLCSPKALRDMIYQDEMGLIEDPQPFIYYLPDFQFETYIAVVELLVAYDRNYFSFLPQNSFKKSDLFKSFYPEIHSVLTEIRDDYPNPLSFNLMVALNRMGAEIYQPLLELFFREMIINFVKYRDRFSSRAMKLAAETARGSNCDYGPFRLDRSRPFRMFSFSGQGPVAVSWDS